VAVFASRYARAFAQVAEADGIAASAAQQQMQDFADTLAGSIELREFLMNPSVEMPQKLKVLDAMAPRLGMSEKVRNFIAVIVEHHRLGDLTDIQTEYGEVADAHAGTTEAQVTSARPLNPEDRATLEAQMAKLAGAKVKASYIEDPSLIGGAVVQIGSTIYDGSVRAQLRQLKQRLAGA